MFTPDVDQEEVHVGDLCLILHQMIPDLVVQWCDAVIVFSLFCIWSCFMNWGINNYETKNRPHILGCFPLSHSFWLKSSNIILKVVKSHVTL